MLIKGEEGYTLTELIVVMAIFLTIMLITSNSFKTIVNQSSQQSKSAETQIGGIVGLEMLRADLEQAGFGLRVVELCRSVRGWATAGIGATTERSPPARDEGRQMGALALMPGV